MNGVLGMAQLMQMTLQNEEKKMAEIIITSGNSLLSIINDILDLSRIEAGKVKLCQEEFDIRVVANEVSEVMQILAKKKGLEYKAYISNEISGYLVGDAERLKQVLFNLLGNSVKFTESGSITLSITKGKVVDDKIQIIISIEDTGIGIQEDKIGKLFTFFTQADDSVTKKYGGTGLGLAISKQLINMMGGEIFVTSKVGVGSNFSASPIFMMKSDLKMLDKIDKEDYNQRILDNTTALLIEDDYVSCLFIGELCKIKNISLKIARSGKQALEILKDESFDVIFMDLQMPIMNGYQVTGMIRGLESSSCIHTPIIAMTAYALKGDREKCLESGMDDYLSKPVDINDFYAMVGKWTKTISVKLE